MIVTKTTEYLNNIENWLMTLPSLPKETGIVGADHWQSGKEAKFPPVVILRRKVERATCYSNDDNEKTIYNKSWIEIE